MFKAGALFSTKIATILDGQLLFEVGSGEGRGGGRVYRRFSRALRNILLSCKYRVYYRDIYVLCILIIPPPSFEIQFFSPTNTFAAGGANFLSL